MYYLKIQHQYLATPEWRLASIHARGAAVTLIAYCSIIENGGVIANCGEWTDHQWLSVAGLGKLDVVAAIEAGLCITQDETLIVIGYDLHAEGSWKIKRAQGHHGNEGGRSLGTSHLYDNNPKGKPKGKPKGSPQPTRNGGVSPPVTPRSGETPEPPGEKAHDVYVDYNERWRMVKVSDWYMALQGLDIKVPKDKWRKFESAFKESGLSPMDWAASVLTARKTKERNEKTRRDVARTFGAEYGEAINVPTEVL